MRIRACHAFSHVQAYACGSASHLTLLPGAGSCDGHVMIMQWPCDGHVQGHLTLLPCAWPASEPLPTQGVEDAQLGIPSSRHVTEQQLVYLQHPDETRRSFGVPLKTPI